MEILWKWIFSAKFQANHRRLCGNCAFPQNLYTRKLGENSVFYAVSGSSLENSNEFWDSVVKISVTNKKYVDKYSIQKFLIFGSMIFLFLFVEKSKKTLHWSVIFIVTYKDRLQQIIHYLHLKWTRWMNRVRTQATTVQDRNVSLCSRTHYITHEIS